jgi:peptidoglycan/xylan/chitin deacetylase (PgdA/CDA1 family)
MMKLLMGLVMAFIFLFSVAGCSEILSTYGTVDVYTELETDDTFGETEPIFSEDEERGGEEKQAPNEENLESTIEDIKEQLMEVYDNQFPTEWGEQVTGVINSINTEENVIALTFDACGGGPLGNGYDERLIQFLIDNEVPATLFFSGNWIDNNMDKFVELASVSLFSIQNHGHRHVPLSVQGKSAYGIRGTSSVSEVIDEIFLNDVKIAAVTGDMPKYFRSGTAYYDNVAVKIANDMGKEVVNYSVVGDGGASFSQKQVEIALLNAKPGSIVLLHMNRPDKKIAEGVMAAVGELLEKGFTFVKLEDYHEKLSTTVVR